MTAVNPAVGGMGKGVRQESLRVLRRKTQPPRYFPFPFLCLYEMMGTNWTYCGHHFATYVVSQIGVSQIVLLYTLNLRSAVACELPPATRARLQPSRGRLRLSEQASRRVFRVGPLFTCLEFRAHPLGCRPSRKGRTTDSSSSPRMWSISPGQSPALSTAGTPTAGAAPYLWAAGAEGKPGAGPCLSAVVV